METKIEERSDRIECTIVVNGGIHDKTTTFYFEEDCDESLALARGEALTWAAGVRNAFDAMSAFAMLQASQAAKPARALEYKQRSARK